MASYHSQPKVYWLSGPVGMCESFMSTIVQVRILVSPHALSFYMVNSFYGESPYMNKYGESPCTVYHQTMILLEIHGQRMTMVHHCSVLAPHRVIIWVWFSPPILGCDKLSFVYFLFFREMILLLALCSAWPDRLTEAFHLPCPPAHRLVKQIFYWHLPFTVPSAPQYRILNTN